LIHDKTIPEKIPNGMLLMKNKDITRLLAILVVQFQIPKLMTTTERFGNHWESERTLHGPAIMTTSPSKEA
jgi:hypothetical protein